MSPSVQQIKGYLPVRLLLPGKDEDPDETFFFVREHRGNNNNKKYSSPKEASSVKPGCTLFVANAPFVPGISTKRLLQSIFGRYADTTRVTVIDNPRNNSTAAKQEKLKADTWWSKNEQIVMYHPSFLEPNFSEGKFAHVVFGSPKELKKTLKLLNDVMRQPAKGYSLPGLVLEKLEIQTLSDESHRQRKESIRKLVGRDDDDDLESDDEENHKKTGILALAQRYHSSSKQVSRAKLLEECNAVIQAYEDAEEEKKRAQEAARAEPDDDGFVTVSYSTAVGSKNELDESMDPTSSHSRRKGAKRSRGNKKASGADELKDFYKFQRRDNRKRSLEDLRKQFEEDLRRVKRMKEERQYRPF